jgi:hypothetical protein
MLMPDEVEEIAKRQRLAGEDTDYEKILKAGRAEP